MTGAWLAVLRRYVLVIAAGNLIWETLQLPLYTIWRDGTAKDLAVAVLHCTGGDVLIAALSLMSALLVFGGGWPEDATAFRRVTIFAVAIGIAYTIFSEWLNIVVRKSWAYSDLMPVVPGLDVGLSPLLQWLVIPVLAFLQARHAGAIHPRRRL